jgi:alpha-glucosidase
VDWSRLTVEAQDGDPSSHLSLYRAALRLRRGHPALGDGRLRWISVPDHVLCFDRDPGFRCVVNFAAAPCELPEHDEVLLTSMPLEDGAKLPSDAAAWLSV